MNPTRQFGVGHLARACGGIHGDPPLVEQTSKAGQSPYCVAAQDRNVLEPRRNLDWRNPKSAGDSWDHVVGWAP